MNNWALSCSETFVIECSVLCWIMLATCRKISIVFFNAICQVALCRLCRLAIAITRTHSFTQFGFIFSVTQLQLVIFPWSSQWSYVLIAAHFSNFARFHGNIKIPRKTANSASRLEILRLAENRGPQYSCSYENIAPSWVASWVGEGLCPWHPSLVNFRLAVNVVFLSDNFCLTVQSLGLKNSNFALLGKHTHFGEIKGANLIS